MDTIDNKMTTFEAEYKKLNKQQKLAVDSIDGPVMVIAGPGTGKTQILALRIGNILLKTDTPASGILCLTFTEAGAKEMKRRLRALIGARAEEVRVHTYHGFAGSVIAEFPDHFPHLSRTKQITDIESETLVRTILRDKKFGKLRPAGEPDFYVGKILGAIRDSKKEAWTPEIVRTFATEEIERVKQDEASLSTRGPTKGQLKGDALKRIEKCERTIIFADAYLAYEEKKRADRKMDFDDLIIELLTALRTDKLLLQMLQEKFLYILVDEHQDTNDSQNMLIRAIADFFDNPNLFVVGDEKQAIFRFQGASVENFLRFQNLWKGMKVISLTGNYRSHQSILDASFAMIENNYAEGEHKNLRIKLSAENGDKPKPVEVVMAGNTEAADKYLVEEIVDILKN
ncbi:MAG: ATP-dependent helicase [Candidatus Pacebacteria bacterium]|nr:ATP-dependent helicase [Candidatus Paceibacterota bacterium]